MGADSMAGNVSNRRSISGTTTVTSKSRRTGVSSGWGSMDALQQHNTNRFQVDDDDGRFPRHYVPAFATVEAARSVARWLPEVPELTLERYGSPYDVSHGVDAELLRNGRARPGCGETAVIGTCSWLRVAKAREAWRDADECVFRAHQLTLDDALMIPFDANVGLLLPTELISEDDVEMVFECHVIEPGFPDCDSFFY